MDNHTRSNDLKAKMVIKLYIIYIHSYRVIERMSASKENISMPLRVLEVYLDAEMYKGFSEQGNYVLGYIYHDLIIHGWLGYTICYFGHTL